MSVLAYQHIKERCVTGPGYRPLVKPCVEQLVVEIGGPIVPFDPGDGGGFRHHVQSTFTASYGLGPCGYDIRLRRGVHISAGGFTLASSMERFVMPNDLCARVLDKSTWARRGLFVQNTIIEPGWEGYLTLELTYHGEGYYELPAGTPIAQIVFEELTAPTELPYRGKYQNQEDMAVEAR